MENEASWDGQERRKHGREEFIKAVVRAIREETIGGVDINVHSEQHRFIEEWIAEVKRKTDRREKIKTQVMGWGIISVLGSIGTGVYHSIVYLREHLR